MSARHKRGRFERFERSRKRLYPPRKQWRLVRAVKVDEFVMRLRVASRKASRARGAAKDRSEREEPLTESEVRFESALRKDQSVIELEPISSEVRLTSAERLPAVVMRFEATFSEDRLVK